VKTLALVAVLALFAGCSDSGRAQTRPAPPPPVPVGVTAVEQKVVPLQVLAVGNVQAYTTVGVKSQVAGQITTVHFKEGDEVKRGDLLFTIDPRSFQAAVRQAEANVAKDRAQLLQAEANLARDLAQLDNARVQDKRYAELLRKELVAREQYDQIRTAMAALDATVQADRAAVENARAAISADEAMVETARIQLGYTTIRAPMDGRTGNLLVQAGNVVKSNEDNPLVVIAQIRPIYVSFGVPEAELTAIKTYRERSTLKVEAVVDGGRRRVEGGVTFMNNTVDPNTGTIQLKATFPNADHALWPGQFVDVALTLTSEPAVVVPSQAVQTGQKGTYVFVVKADSTAEARPVKVGRRLAREVTIESGVTAGERVVTDGQLRLAPGARVDPKPPKAS
jgi:membrane fusion protein, multidrug efflux system